MSRHPRGGPSWACNLSLVRDTVASLRQGPGVLNIQNVVRAYRVKPANHGFGTSVRGSCSSARGLTGRSHARGTAALVDFNSQPNLSQYRHIHRSLSWQLHHYPDRTTSMTATMTMTTTTTTIMTMTMTRNPHTSHLLRSSTAMPTCIHRVYAAR